MSQKIVDEIFLDINHTGSNYVRTKFICTKSCWTKLDFMLLNETSLDE